LILDHENLLLDSVCGIYVLHFGFQIVVMGYGLWIVAVEYWFMGFGINHLNYWGDLFFLFVMKGFSLSPIGDLFR
jgi:hypothetical protein